MKKIESSRLDPKVILIYSHQVLGASVFFCYKHYVTIVTSANVSALPFRREEIAYKLPHHKHLSFHLQQRSAETSFEISP
jgi:hypothetical protein